MRFILLIVSLCVLGNGIYVGVNASNSIHQIYAAAQYLIAAVLFVGAAICSEVASLRGKLGQPTKAEPVSIHAADTQQSQPKQENMRGVWITVAVLVGVAAVVIFGLRYAHSQGWIS